MKKRLFTLAMILLLSLNILTVIHFQIAQAVPYLALQDAEMATKFNEGWGPATVVITDVAGPGVRFDYTGLTSSGTAKCDGFPIDSLAGGSDDGHGGYGDFTGYTHYKMRFTNVGTSPVTVNLFMNTGFAADGAGYDTYWECSWTGVPAGESRVVTLDFSGAITYGATDDPNPAWRYSDGTVNPIHRLNHVSKIGFQVLGSGAGSVIVSNQYEARLYVDPPVTTKYYGVDSFFDVYARIDSVNDLFGLDIDIRWDDTLMTYKEESYDTYLTAMWGAGTYQVTNHSHGVNAGEGYYRFIAVCTHVPPGFSTTESQVIFKLSFNVVDPLTNSKKTGPIHFATHKLSDSNAQSVSHTAEDGVYEVWGMTLTIDMTHAGGYSRTCRKTHDDEVGHGDELFTLTMAISEARNLAGVDFEIHFDTAKLDCQSYTIVWGDTGSSVTVDETGGKVTGNLIGSGSPTTLVTLTFKPDPAYWRIWKDSALQPQHDDINPTGIHFHSVTLHYTGLPDLTWTSGGGGGGISIPHENFAYTFSPIKGDLDLDGLVDIGDLGWEAGLYDSTNPTMNLIGDSVIDIFDLVIIASNFWAHYVQPLP